MLIDEKKKDTKLPSILRAALELFVVKGINATTTKDIAAKAGTAEGTLYRHFKSKEKLAYYIFHTHLVDLTGALYEIIGKEKSAKAKLTASVKYFYDYFEKDSVLFTYIFLAQHQELRNFPDKQETPWHVVQAILKQAKKEKKLLNIDIDLATAMVLGIVSRVAEQRVIGNFKGNLRRHSQTVADAAWRAVAKD